MILRLFCPTGHVLDVDAQLAGRKIRCGACGAIMIVPVPAKGPLPRPAARPQAPARPPLLPAENPLQKPQTPPVKPAPPPTEPSLDRPAAPPTRAPSKPTADLPPPPTPNLAREPGMVALPLPPAAAESGGEPPAPQAVARRPVPGIAALLRLRKLWPAAERHLPGDATVPSKAERRIALQLAGVLTATALLGLLPVIGMGQVDLRLAPPWALAAVGLAVLQMVYAAWMVNAPDWVSAQVQMAVSAVATTIYGMLMTLSIVTPRSHGLILGLSEVRRLAPAWCGLMFLIMGAATWFCGRTSARWRRSLAVSDEP